jgi:ankyrin repeat protein
VKGVREALKALPNTLAGSYVDAMARIREQNDESRSTAYSTLIWVANAKRPLTAVELQTALAIEPGTKGLDQDNILDIDIILSVCAGLVIVDEQVSVVRLVHYTTQEYLESIQLQQFPDAQIEITRSLLTYLTFEESLSPDSELAFLKYSQYCLMHAAGPPEHALNDMVLVFLAGAMQWRMRWATSGVPPWAFEDWPSQPSTLWVAAAANLLETAKFILLNGASHQQGSDCPEIHVAAYYGHLHMVKLLIEHGSDMNVQGGYYGSALYAASMNGHKDVVQLLIEYGADVNGHERSTSQALEDAGWNDMLQLLSDIGVPSKMKAGHHGSALHVASVIGHQEIVQLLIKHGADVNVQRGYYGTALQAASGAGHKHIVQLLIEHGADANAKGGHHGSALQAALDIGHEDIVQLLIEHIYE